MATKTRWIFILLTGFLLLGILGLFLVRKSLEAAEANQAITPFVPLPGEVDPTATFFSPSEVTPTIPPDLVWVDPGMPGFVQQQLEDLSGLKYADQRGEAGTELVLSSEKPLIYLVYALAGPFDTLMDVFSKEELRGVWSGSGDHILLMSEETSEVFASLWGDPEAGAVEVLSPDQLLSRARSRPSALAVLPFESLTPEWKVLQVDGSSPLEDDFDPGEYFLSVPVSALGTSPELFQDLRGSRSPDKFSSVVLTGVTALVRATAWTMEQQGINYPARDILPYLQSADILHISNEVPFLAGCPFPDPGQAGLRFCSDPRYIELMETIGTDVVELTGDHFGDYGPEAMLYTLDLYNQRGWPYYGGGRDRSDAMEPVLLEHNGNLIAFLGCNAKGGGYATAGAGYPGAVACDFPALEAQIRDLREQGYNPIATFQHFEYYTYLAQPDQIRDARRLVDAGAVIVSGSQAHQPQAFEFRNGALIHHGLGNLFFDQIYEIPPHTASAFIDRHIFYDGRHISTELLTIKFEDFARARPMTPAERDALLRATFSASGW